MNKIILITNSRFNYEFPSNHHKWINIQNDYFTNILYPLLRSELTSNDIIILMGNTFENSHTIPPEIIEQYIIFLKELSSISKVMILNGNKDITRSNKKTHSLNSLSSLVNDVTIVNNIIHIDNVTILPPKFTSKDLQSNPASIISNILISNNDQKIITHPIFNNYTLKFTPHNIQDVDNIIALKSLLQMSSSEESNNIGIHLINTLTLEHKLIENLRSPRYSTVHINTSDDIDLLNDNKHTNHINLIISSELLNMDRSAKRKMGFIINEKKFNKISYTTIETTEPDKVENRKVNPADSFDSIIRNEILNINNIDTNMLLEEYENVYRLLKTKKE